MLAETAHRAGANLGDPLRPKFVESTFRNGLENPDGLHSEVLWVGKNGLRSTLIAALRYQKHAIQTPPAIFQTVPPRTRVNRS